MHRRSALAAAVLTSLASAACALSSDVAPGGGPDDPGAASAALVDLGATPVAVGAAANGGSLIPWSTFTANPTDTDANRIRDILLNANKYSLTHWYQVRGYDTQTDTYLDLGGSGENRIRAAGSVAMALAVSLKLGIYDSRVTTVSRASAEAIALKLIRSIAYHHRINDNGDVVHDLQHWGHDWQTSLWTLYAGTAAWLMWDQLGATDATYVRKMVEDEGRRLVGYPVDYYRDENDQLTGRSEQSAAEENAWNAQFLYLAVNMMPTHPLRKAWEYKAAELAVSAHARPIDHVANNQIVGGRPVKSWLRGSNVEANGGVINHDRIHPDYMATAAYAASAPIWYGLNRSSTPDTMFVRVADVYETLVEHAWSAPPYDAPGGTMYIDGSPSVYYPQGTDWGTKRRMNFVLFDVVARHFGLDGLVTEKAGIWEDLHAGDALAEQGRSTNGRTYISDSEDSYPGAEEWVAAHAALTYLVKWIAAQNVVSRTGAFVPVVLDNQDVEFNVTGPWEKDYPFDGLGFNNVYHEGGGASGSRRAQWKPHAPLPAGTYRISAWWSAFPNHATDAPYSVVHRSGTTTVRVNQRLSGNRWNSLGIFELDGTSNTGFVELSNATSTGYVVADGVMFEKI